MSKTSPDWDAIKRDYQSGEFTVRELEDRHGVPKSTIQRRINRERWEKDLVGQIATARRAKVARIDADEHVKSQRDKGVGQEMGQAEVGQPVPLSTVVEQAAERHVEIIQDHRRKTKRLRAQADRQLELVDWWLNGDENRQGEASRRLFVGKGDTLTAHLNSAMNVVEKIIRLERELYGLDNSGSAGSLDKAASLRDELQRRLVRLAPQD